MCLFVRTRWSRQTGGGCGSFSLQTEQRDFKCSERPRRGSFRPFTTVQTSPAGRTSLGQVGHIRKCVFVISADMGICVKAESLSRRLFSLSRAGLLSKPREDKQCLSGMSGPGLFVSFPSDSLPVGGSTAATSHLCFFNVAFIYTLSEPCQNQWRRLKLCVISEQHISNINERGGRKTEN